MPPQRHSKTLQRRPPYRLLRVYRHRERRALRRRVEVRHYEVPDYFVFIPWTNRLFRLGAVCQRYRSRIRSSAGFRCLCPFSGAAKPHRPAVQQTRCEFVRVELIARSCLSSRRRAAVLESLRSIRALASMMPDFVADKLILVRSIVGALCAESPSGESLPPALLIGRVIAGPRAANAALQTPGIPRDGLLSQR